jgi:phage terminase large subunit-like protein
MMSKEETNAKKRELAMLLAERNRRKDEQPEKYTILSTKQKVIIADNHQTRLVLGGNRSGKTFIGGYEAALLLRGVHPSRKVKMPFHMWACSPSFDTQESTNQASLLINIPQSEIIRREFLRGKILRRIVLKNGSTVNFKSYEQGSSKFQGAGLDMVWFDEEPSYSIYEEATMRYTAGKELAVLLTMTPVNGVTWVYDQLYLATTPNVGVHTMGWDDNPYLTEDQKEKMSEGLSPEMLRIRRDGSFIARVGGVCNWFDRNIHIRHYDHYDSTWQYYEVFDGGYSDPAAWLLCAIDGEGAIHVVNGFRKKELLPEQIVEQRNIRKGGLTIINGWTDNDNPRLQQELSGLGMPLQPVVKSVPTAIGPQAIKANGWDEYLAQRMAFYGEISKVTGKPKLFISDNLLDYNDSGHAYNWLVQEIENLKWREKGGMSDHETIPKWDDHRRFQHHFDGIRSLAYFVVSYMQPPKPYNQQRNGRLRQRILDFMVG